MRYAVSSNCLSLAFVALLTLFWIGSAASGAPVLKDSRTISDMAKLHIDLALGESWASAFVMPDDDSPEFKRAGIYIEGSTGKITQTSEYKESRSVHGKITILAPLKKAARFPTQYSWEFGVYFNTPYTKIPSENEVRFSPFHERGGAIIFRYNEKAVGAAQFNPVYLIPDNWAPFVLPAFKFQQASKSVFDETKVVANVRQLTTLLDDKNPFNAVDAARLLAPQRGLDTAFIASTLASSSSYEQAIFTYLTFKNAHPIRQVAIDSALGKVIDKAASSETLKWIALGITTAQNDDGQSYFTLKDRVKALLLKVDARQKALNTKTPADDYVTELLIGAQIRQPIVTKAPIAKPNVGF